MLDADRRCSGACGVPVAYSARRRFRLISAAPVKRQGCTNDACLRIQWDILQSLAAGAHRNAAAPRSLRVVGSAQHYALSLAGCMVRAIGPYVARCTAYVARCICAAELCHVACQVRCLCLGSKELGLMAVKALNNLSIDDENKAFPLQPSEQASKKQTNPETNNPRTRTRI